MWDEEYEEDLDPLAEDGEEESTDDEDFGDSDFDVGGEEDFLEDED